MAAIIVASVAVLIGVYLLLELATKQVQLLLLIVLRTLRFSHRGVSFKVGVFFALLYNFWMMGKLSTFWFFMSGVISYAAGGAVVLAPYLLQVAVKLRKSLSKLSRAGQHHF